MTRLGAPLKEPERPRRYSYSQISTYWECPQKYYQKYVMKVPDKVSGPWMAWGSAVHSALEGLPPEVDTEIDVAPYVEAVNGFYKSVNDSPAHNELRLEYKLFGRDFVSVVDCITANGYIVDYKVTSAPSYLKGHVGYQLPIYKMAAKIVGLGEYRPQYIILKRGKEGEFIDLSDYCPSLPDWKMGKIESIVERILDEMDRSFETNVWPYRAGNCFRCPFKQQCPFYG